MILQKKKSKLTHLYHTDNEFFVKNQQKNSLKAIFRDETKAKHEASAKFKTLKQI